MKIAIISGSGKMGRWLASYLLREGHQVVISDRDRVKLKAAGSELGVDTANNIEAVKEVEIVILSVGINSFEEVVKEIGPHIRPSQLVLDITSIKEFPVEVMQKYLHNIPILGTHPVFGPGAKDLKSQNFVLTPTNEKERLLAEKVKKYLEERGARVSTMSPEEHDRMMAVVLGLSHFISIVSADTLISIDNTFNAKAVGGSTYRVLNTLIESVMNEDPELYATLQMHLPGLTELENIFKAKTEKWADLVKNKDKAGFKDNMVLLKEQYSKQKTDFGRSYENMYKIMEWL